MGFKELFIKKKIIKEQRVPFIYEITDHELLYLFNGKHNDFYTAIKIAIEKINKKLTLLGTAESCKIILEGLNSKFINKKYKVLDFSKLDKILDSRETYLLCSFPKNDEEWCAISSLKNKNIIKLWDIIYSLSILNNLVSNYEFNNPNLLSIYHMYQDGNDSFERILNKINKILKTKNFILNKNIIEFGPSDGNQTSSIIKRKPKKITSVEGRPENILKLITAKYLFNWDNLDIISANFLSFSSTIKYDLVMALGVCYHVDSPFYFLDKILNYGNTIILSSWFANIDNIRGERSSWNYLGEDYHGDIYYEPDHFLSGLQKKSIYLDYDSFKKFMFLRDFSVTEIASNEESSEVTGIFKFLLLQKKENKYL